jgi:hypothetical protein
MSDAIASGRDSRRFALPHHTRRQLGGLPLPPNLGFPEFGTLSWPKSDKSDFGWEREQTDSASRQT